MAGHPSRKPIPAELEAKLLVESRYTCNICWKSQEVQIHHIDPVEEGGDNSEENLIVLCLNCHSKTHTTREMARNVRPHHLRLFKETWLECVRRDPLATNVTDNNDVDTIYKILRQGHRRALYFPFDVEMASSMFRSLDDFRVFIQSIGFKLIKNDEAREQVVLLYKALVEIAYFEPIRPRDYCLFELGEDILQLLELRRKTACFHLNGLATLVGLKGDFLAEDEFKHIGFDLGRGRPGAKRCFGHFDNDSESCHSCEFKRECVQAWKSFISSLR
jgi:hypothetical protein